MLEEKRRSISSASNKLRNGLVKIEDTKREVETMRVQLEEAQVKGNKYYMQCDKEKREMRATV
jgi:peptidoglycan hydrolase CwlO-like protein